MLLLSKLCGGLQMISNKLLRELTGNAVKILLYFDRNIMDGEVAIPVRKIATDLNLNVGTVVKNIDILINHEIIAKRIVREGQTVRAYYSWNENELLGSNNDE